MRLPDGLDGLGEHILRDGTDRSAVALVLDLSHIRFAERAPDHNREGTEVHRRQPRQLHSEKHIRKR